jgi:hypothetical protein
MITIQSRIGLFTSKAALQDIETLNRRFGQPDKRRRDAHAATPSEVVEPLSQMNNA